MKKYKIRFYPKAEKEVQKLNKKDKEKVLKSIISLQNDPYIGKKLKGEFQGFYSLRVWPFRIIYSVYKRECFIIIIRVGQRKDAYN